MVFGNNEYPKVLVIDPTPFNRTRNNGIVKSNLFQGWPKDRIAQIDYSNIEPGFDVCNRYWSLNKIDILKGMIGLAPYAEIPVPDIAEDYANNPTFSNKYDNRPLIERKLSQLNPQLRTIIGEGIFLLPSVLSQPLRNWIDEFQPDIVYSILSTASILRTVVNVSQWKNIPIVPFITDDWITTLYNDNFFRKLLRQNLNNLFRQCLDRSPICLTICESMSEEYHRRYGGVYKSFMNSVDHCDVGYELPKSSDNRTIQLLFIGSLAPGRWQSLREIGEALLALRKENVEAELLIYTFPSEIKCHAADLTLDPVMRIVGTATPDEVPRLQHEADILVHVESFDAANREYTRFSLSTKIPQYMMAGACIFAYGPGEVASLRYLEDSHAAIVIGEPDKEKLITTLKELVQNATLRATLSKRAKKIALERHDGNNQRILFRNTIIDICDKWKQQNN